MLAVAVSAAELTLSARLQSDFAANQALCRLYLCDERAVANQAYQWQLAPGAGSLRTAVAALREIVQRDPASAQRWADLGDALAQAGSLPLARRCFQRALELGATSADVLILAGDFNLRYGDRHTALHLLRRVLTLTPNFDEAIFSRFSARETSSEELLQYGVPQEPRASRAYLRYVMQQGDTAGARATWLWMQAHHLLDAAIAVDYTNYLAVHQLYAEAAGAWAASVARTQPGYRQAEFLYNGSFASEPVSAALFDWHLVALEHVEMARDSRTGLRIQFDGSANLDFSNISQEAVLPPGKYRFRAVVHADHITTDQGLLFRINDIEAPSRLDVQTQPILGTSEWHSVETSFTVASATRIVMVSVIRHPSLRFDNKLGGTAWIKQLSLVPQ